MHSSEGVFWARLSPSCTNSKYLSLAGCRPFSRRQSACPRCRTPRCRSWLPPTRATRVDGERVPSQPPQLNERLSNVCFAQAPPPERGPPISSTKPHARRRVNKRDGGKSDAILLLPFVGTLFLMAPKRARSPAVRSKISCLF